MAAQEGDSSRPVFNRAGDSSFTLSDHRFTRSQLHSFPFRGLQNYLSIVPGVVSQNDNLYVRGSRAGDIGYVVDGFSVTNPFFNSNGVEIIPEALEALDVSTGAFGPEFGAANGGIVHSHMRTGSDSLQFSVDLQSDNAVSTGNEFFNTTSFGYNNLVGTVCGPVMPGIKFFMAGQYNYLGNRQPMFLEPFRFNLVTDFYGSHPSGQPLPGPVEFKRNFLDDNWRASTTIQGNAVMDLENIRLYVLGSYSNESWLEAGAWPSALQNIFRLKRSMVNGTKSWFGAIRLTHAVVPEVSYDLGVSIYSRSYHRYDPDFGDDWQSYPDSLANAQKGYYGFTSKYQGPYDYTSIYGFRFYDPSAPNNSYDKNNQNSVALSFNLNSQITSDWQFAAGGQLSSWTIRNFSVSYINNRLSLERYYSSSPMSWPNPYYRRVTLTRYYTNNYGYDVDGNETEGVTYDREGTFDGPFKPSFGSAYVKTKVEFQDLILNLGLRYEYFNPEGLEVPSNLYDAPPYDTLQSNLDILKESILTQMQSTGFVLPSMSLSFRAAEGTVLNVSYEKHSQFPSLNQLYTNDLLVLDRLNPSYSVPTWFGGTLPGFTMRPERVTQYEFGLEHKTSDRVWLSVRTYYRRLADQLQLGRVYGAQGKARFISLINTGEGIAKGAEVSITFVPNRRFTFLLSYALSDSRGKSSYPTWNKFEVTDEQVPPIANRLFPFDYDQTHRGSMLLDVRFTEEDGDVLNGFSLTSIATFNSGHRFTSYEPLTYLGASTTWNVGVRPLLDVRSATPTEEWNTSTTPWIFNLDFRLSKQIRFPFMNLEVYLNVLNALNTRNTMNVYPTTGSTNDDGWFSNPYAQPYLAMTNYEQFYRAINLQNRWAYMGATGYDIYGLPRQIRFGVKLEM